MEPSTRARLALSCTRDGTITRVVYDDLGIVEAGKRFVEIVDSGSARKAEALLAAIVDGQCVVGWTLNVPHGDHARPLEFAGFADGDTLQIFAAPGPGTEAGRDHQIYDELSRLNNEVINRERELARRGAALERLSAEKGRIVAIAAHDLRNPLTVIASYAELLRLDGALEGEHLGFLEEIARSARFMMELVEEMLATSRLESGLFDLDLEEIDLVLAASHAATINRLRAERKEIGITFEPQTSRAPIRADAVKLRQIINNLVVNAIKFSPARTNVTIRVRDAGERALIEVQDQGIGIPPDKLQTIFEPFKTLGPTGTAGEVSTGLGLAIVKQLATLHGATIEVESAVDRGSLFRVAFPISSN